MDAYKLDNETHVGHSWSDGHTRNMKCDHKLQEKDINLMRSKNLSKFMAFKKLVNPYTALLACIEDP
jgi:hypothetical protein